MVNTLVLHNSISLDGSLTQFTPHLLRHYQIVADYHPQAHLIGSNTIQIGIDLYGEGIPPEEPRDFQKPERDSTLPYWVILDSQGKLQGLLHTCRRFELCREIIVLVTETTPSTYLQYLKTRQYTYHVVGERHADLPRVLNLLTSHYQVQTLLVDTGMILGNLLLNQGFVTELSLLIHPTIVGTQSYPMFANIQSPIQLQLLKHEIMDDGYVWLVYAVQVEQKTLDEENDA